MHWMHRIWISDANFPGKGGQEQLSPIMVRFEEDLTIEEARAELDKLSLRPGDTHELLALAIQCPDENDVFAIGQLFKPRKSVGIPSIRRYRCGRGIWLDWHEKVSAGYSFLAFEK